jgi:hypothetical protein
MALIYLHNVTYSTVFIHIWDARNVLLVFTVLLQG